MGHTWLAVNNSQEPVRNPGSWWEKLMEDNGLWGIGMIEAQGYLYHL